MTTTAADAPMTAEELQGLLKLAGRSHRWLAERVGVRRNTVQRWAAGEYAIPGSRAARIRELLSPTCPTCGASR